MGIEPTWLAWKARTLPLSYTRTKITIFFCELKNNLQQITSEVLKKI